MEETWSLKKKIQVFFAEPTLRIPQVDHLFLSPFVIARLHLCMLGPTLFDSIDLYVAAALVSHRQPAKNSLC